MSTHDTENERDTRVTVIIPCHNHADTIVRALRSVGECEYPYKQVVVVNDGSKDNPRLAIEGWCEEHEYDYKPHAEGMTYEPCRSIHDGFFTTHLLYNTEPAKGPSAARNIGMKYTWDDTDVFMMLDADDYYLPGKIEKSVRLYEEDPKNIGLVYTDAIIENQSKGTRVYEYRRSYDRDVLERECMISNTPLVSKTALEVCGGYDEGMRTAEDWDLWLRITEQFVAIHLPEALHVYSVTGQNASDVVPREVWEENWRKIHQRVLSTK